MKNEETIRYIDIDKITPDSEQPRKTFNDEKIKQLAQTYKNQGIIQPIEIDENNQIIIGERRWRACKLARLKQIPCKIVKGLTEEQKLERRIIENIHNEPLVDIEKAKAIAKLIKMKGWTKIRACTELGISETTLSHLLSLVEAPEEIKKFVEEDKLSLSDAGEISYRLKDKPKKAIEVAKKAAKISRNRRERVRRLIKEDKLEERKVEIPKDKFNIIYADPPWKYHFSKDYSRSIPAHYPDMELEEICNLKINVAGDAILFLWATNPKLEEAMQVIKSWGFEYKTNFVWVKDKIGMGYYCRSKHELLLIATKGNFSVPKPEDRFPSVINATRSKHSAKPEIVYEMIEKMYPKGKYLELFSRNKRKNWSGWGLEYEN